MSSFITTKLLTYVSGGLLVALIAAGVWIALAEAKAQHNYDQWQLVETRLAVSNASIDTLTAALERKNEESRQRAEALEQARSEAAQDALRFARDRQNLEGRISSLTGLIREREGECAVDAEVLGELEGL